MLSDVPRGAEKEGRGESSIQTGSKNFLWPRQWVLGTRQYVRCDQPVQLIRSTEDPPTPAKRT